MSRYVLEILDGDQAGTVLTLSKGRLGIGRRPDNGLVLRDEKCSGHHAEIEFEDGAYVLRDLESTNGSLIDGRKVTEVALSNFDIFQLGRVQIRFREEGASDPAEDMQVLRLDHAALSARRGPRMRSMGLLALLLVACGTLAWLSFFAPGGSGLGGPILRSPLDVPGNQLAEDVANLEAGSGWDLQAGGSAFEPAFSRRDAHTGSGCIEARWGEAEQSFALTRISEPIPVLAGTALRLRAYLRTEGAARMAIRARFSSSTGDSILSSGTVPVSHEVYQVVDLVMGVPQGMDRLEVEILALLPEQGAAGYADDIAVLSDQFGQSLALEISSRDGRLLRLLGSSFLVRGQEPTLLGVSPLLGSGSLSDLARSGLLVPSDVGQLLGVESLDREGFRIGFTQPDGGEAVAGLILRFPAASRPCSIIMEDGRFLSQSSEISDQKSTEVLLGHGPSRCLLQFSDPVTLSGRSTTRGYELEISGKTEFELHLVLDAAVRHARDLVRQARQAMSRGEMRAALDSLSVVRLNYPHDETVLQQAEDTRREILTEMRLRVAALREAAADATFFRSRNGFARVHQGIEALLSVYGASHLPQSAALGKLSVEMEKGLQTLDSLARTDHAQRLQVLEEAFRSSAQEDLADLVRGYLDRYYRDAQGGGGR